MSDLMKREVLVEAITQNIAPRLFKLSGDNPAEMGFPIGDSKEDFEDRLARQFDPVTYWTEKAREIANSLVNIMEAGRIDFSPFDYDAAVDVAFRERPDLHERRAP